MSPIMKQESYRDLSIVSHHHCAIVPPHSKRYYIPSDGDDAQHPNIFHLPGNVSQPTLRDVRQVCLVTHALRGRQVSLSFTYLSFLHTAFSFTRIISFPLQEEARR